MTRVRSSAALAAGFALLLGPSNSTPAEEQAASAQTASGYLIGPADVLRIIVWKEPELSLEVTVRIDGMITFPLLGDLPAGGRAPSQLAESLAKGLERFVETPRVSVGVSQANSARFYVVGQVARPGAFPLSSRTSVLQALALAGGLREFAKAESIVIVREDQTIVSVNYKRLADGKDVAQNVWLAPGDTIVVP